MDKIKLTEEIKANFIKAMEEKGFDAFAKSVKEASDEDTGTFEVVITTEDVDRYNEIIKLDGWDIEHYMRNPVVLWGHDHYRMPVGVCTAIERQEKGLVARGKFAPSNDGQELRRLYDLGIVRATSVGFIEKERQGNVILKAELIEFSFVSVPANPMALSTLIKSNINVNELVTKGFMHVEIKDADEETETTDEDIDNEIVDETPGDDETTDDDGEKMVSISKSKLASIKLALKEAGDVLEDIEEDASDEDEPIDDEPEHVDNEDAIDTENENETEDEKALRHFTESRKLAQVAASALAESLAQMRKVADSKF